MTRARMFGGMVVIGTLVALAFPTNRTGVNWIAGAIGSGFGLSLIPGLLLLTVPSDRRDRIGGYGLPLSVFVLFTIGAAYNQFHGH